MSDLNQQQKDLNTSAPSEDGAFTLTEESQPLFGAEMNSSELKKQHNSKPRPFKPKQFLFGLGLSAGGIGLMLFVAAGALHDVGGGGAVSLPATGLCMILGLMMLGGGFGQMAISSPQFDDTEFQRLLNGETKEDDSEAQGGNEAERDAEATAGDSHSFPSQDGNASDNISDDSNPSQQANVDNQARLTPDLADGRVDASADVSKAKKRLHTEGNDHFVSTVLSDVVASQG